MFNRDTINGKGRAETGNAVTGILVLVFAMFFAISLASSAIASENASSLKGEVVAVDTYDNTLTVRPIEAARSSAMGTDPELTFTIDKMTSVTGCTQNKTLEDITAGEQVTVTYHEEGGRLFADAVDIPPVILACYQ